MEMLITLKLQSGGLLPVQVQKTQILATGSARELLFQTERKLQLPGTLITIRELGQMELPLPKTPSVVSAQPTTLKVKTKSPKIPTGRLIPKSNTGSPLQLPLMIEPVQLPHKPTRSQPPSQVPSP
jgi:hypothetical protein